MNKPKALVVLSGGQDSTTCLAWAVNQGYDVAAVTFNYGQRHAIELDAAKSVAALMGVVDHEVINMEAILKGTSPLTNPDEKLETYSDYASMDKIIGDRVEKTFVPMRNSLFLTIAANRAVVGGSPYLVTGVCEADNANYPDCRQSFISAQEWTINEALGHNDTMSGPAIRILTPLIRMSKADSIRMMMAMNCLPLLAFTHTAYDGTYPPVSKDHASVLRAQGFLEANVPDPLVVRAHLEGLMDLPATPNYADVNMIAALGIKIQENKAHLLGNPDPKVAA